MKKKPDGKQMEIKIFKVMHHEPEGIWYLDCEDGNLVFLSDLKLALGAECEENILIARPHALSETKANLNFIVRACNSHYDLLEACEALLRESDHGQYKDASGIAQAQYKAQQAIQKAKGE